MSEITPLVIGGKRFYLHGPIYELILTRNGDKLTCEKVPGKPRRKCRINGRFVSVADYVARSGAMA